MGVLFDYFAADSDQDAAAVIDRVGGPGSQQVLAPRPAKSRWGLFGRKDATTELASDAQLPVHDTVSGKGIDPVVQLGKLEALLTGRPYAEVVDDPRSGHALEIRDGGERVVCTLTDSLALARRAEANRHRLYCWVCV